MKKLMAIVLVLSMLVFVAAGCGGQTPKNDEKPASGKIQENDQKPAEGQTKESVKKLKIGFIVAGKLGDNGFNDATNEGAKRFAKDNDVELTVVEPGEFKDNEIHARNFAEQGYDLVLLGDNTTSDIIPQVAKDFPDTHFVIFEGTAGGVENITSLRFRVAEAGFLTGAFSILMSDHLAKVKETAFIGGMRNPALERSQYSFTAGAEYVGGKCKVAYVGNFTDVAKAKEIALQVYGDGLVLVQSYAGGAGNGVFQAAESKGEGYYTMGGATGQFHLSPKTIIASQVKNIDTSVYDACSNFRDGKLKSGIIEQGLAEGAVGIKYSPELGSKVPQEIKDKIEEISKKIISGEIVPPSTEKEYGEFAAKHLKK